MKQLIFYSDKFLADRSLERCAKGFLGFRKFVLVAVWQVSRRCSQGPLGTMTLACLIEQ